MMAKEEWIGRLRFFTLLNTKTLFKYQIVNKEVGILGKSLQGL